nr:MAG TPA: hypothetical protein [Bacteriophage sp.]
MPEKHGFLDTQIFFLPISIQMLKFALFKRHRGLTPR